MAATDGGAPSPTSSKLLWRTVAAMILGVVVGWGLGHAGLSDTAHGIVVQTLATVTALFLRLIKMIVAPLILATLIAGIAQMGGGGSVGKIGLRALAWFMIASFVAIAIGLATADLLQPGRGLGLRLPAAAAGAPAARLDVPKMIEDFVPTSIVDAMAGNHVLQIVVFAVFTGIAIGGLGPRAEAVRTLAEQTSAIMLRIAGYVMAVAPLAVFSALAETTLTQGIDTVAVLGRMVVQFYVGLFAMAAVTVLAGWLFLGRRIGTLLTLVREPMLIAFSTSSSEASYPAALAALEQFGVSRRVTGLVLPLGYAFNLAGLLVYAAFCVLFIAQAYGVAMGWQAQIGIMLFLLVANKGVAGVPRAGLVNLTLALQAFDLPVAGVALILGIDALMDMGRSAVNVLGNTVATAAIAAAERDDRPPALA